MAENYIEELTAYADPMKAHEKTVVVQLPYTPQVFTMFETNGRREAGRGILTTSPGSAYKSRPRKKEPNKEGTRSKTKRNQRT